MARYLVGRVIGLVIVFIIVSIVAFLLMHSVPGGPFSEEKSPLPPAAKANIMRKYGLDKPLYVQYLRYMGSALQGDFGISFQSPTETVIQLIGRTWPVSIRLGGLAILVAFTSGLAFGIIAAIKQNSWIDSFVDQLTQCLFGHRPVKPMRRLSTVESVEYQPLIVSTHYKRFERKLSVDVLFVAGGLLVPYAPPATTGNEESASG